MSTTETTIFSDGQFWIQDGDTIPQVDTWDQSNGLAVTADSGATILTGDGIGPITVALDVHADQPTEADDPLAFDDPTAPWQDIVEISVACADGPLRVCDSRIGFIHDLPTLDAQGAGYYRLRVHVRGRDQRVPGPDGFPQLTDQFLIVSWPAPERPPLSVRLTDRRGLGTRMSWANHPTRRPITRPGPRIWS